MSFKTNPMSMAIKVITGFVIIGTILFIGFSILRIELLIPGGIIFIVAVGCYLTSPKEYVIEGGMLQVRSILKNKTLGTITSAERVTEKPSFTFKVWANGGLFGGTGIFWNRTWGIFRAYITSARYEDMVFIQTDIYKAVVLTPENPEGFIDKVTNSNK